MAENYPPNFKYTDFATQFTGELFNATAWAQIFKASGAKYIVPTSKHHEGFCNWPSPTSWNWNSVDNGPHIDIIGEIANAVRAEGLIFGVYHSLFEWFNPLYLADKANNFQTQTFSLGKTIPELMDLVQRYQPDYIWSDGDWEATDKYWNSTEFIAWLFNDSPVKDTVLVNDRWGQGDTCTHGSVWTCDDRYQPGSLQNHKWENALTIDQYSWGYRRNAVPTDYLSVDYFVDQLIETVSCGGNMLLNIGPAHDGSIDAIFVDRLLGIGNWLAVNGDAIYATIPWRAQNDTSSSVWYTQSGDKSTIYAMFTSWPTVDNGVNITLTIPVAKVGTSSVTFMGATGVGPLSWVPLTTPGQPGMIITLPMFTPATIPCDNAWTLILTGVQ